MNSPDTHALATGIRQWGDQMGELEIAAKSFSLNHDAYRTGYDKIYTVYQSVLTARHTLEGQGSALRPEDVSARIPGITQGATLARDTLVGAGGESLLAALRYLEQQLSTLLTDMHESYVAYGRTDRESAFDLVSKVGADTP